MNTLIANVHRPRNSSGSLTLRTSLLAAVASIGMSALGATPAHAGSILHVGPGVNSPCATGGSTTGPCQYLYDNHQEVNGITGSEADIYVNSNDPNIELTTLYAILGVPNSASFSTMNAMSGTTYEGPGGTAEANLTASFVKGGTMGPGTMPPGQEAYSQLGITGTNNSNNFNNWSGADSAVNGLSVSGFNLYEFQLTLDSCVPPTGTCNGIDLEGQELVDLSFTNPLPLGTFLIGYGTQTGKNDKTTIYDTPFTEAGLVNSTTTVPEPGALALFAAGLAGLGLALWRRRKSV